MAEATFRWSDVRLTYGVDAVQAWDVVKAATAIEAIGAVPVTAGSTHPHDNTLTADPLSAEAQGFKFWKVTANYKAAGSGGGGGSSGAVLGRPKLRWTRGTVSGSVDVDAANRPLFNSAGDLFDGQTREKGERGFIITRVEQSYNLAKADEYEDTINDSTVTLLNKYTFAPRTLRLVSYMPAGDIDFDATTIQAEYLFLIRRDTWRRRLPDRGNRGWYTGDGGTKKKDAFVTDKGQILTDVLLDGTGKPIDPEIRVGPDRKEPIANPTPVTPKAIENAPKMTFMIYDDDFPEKPFSGLEL